MRSRSLILSLLTISALAFTCASASAVDVNEPNNDIAHASGPIQDGVVYRGEITHAGTYLDPTDLDIDYFRFSLPQDSQQVHVAIRFWQGDGTPAGCPDHCRANVGFAQTSGNVLFGNSGSTSPGDGSRMDSYNITQDADLTYHASLDYTVPSHGDYLLVLQSPWSGFPGTNLMTYEFTMTRAAGINPPAPTPVTPTSTPEPTDQGPSSACTSAQAANTRAYSRYKSAKRAYSRHRTRARKRARANALSSWRRASARVRTYC